MSAEANDPSRLFLTGMMGAGKSCIGQRIAKALGWRFVDLDALVATRAGQDIPAIFAEEGEEGFRRWERDALLAELDVDGDEACVIALGGGAYAQEGVANLLRGRGYTVYLEVPTGEIARRLGESEPGLRPMLDGDRATVLEKLARERLGFYRQADGVVDGVGTPAVVAARVLDHVGRSGLGSDFRSFQVQLEHAPYPIWLGGGTIAQAAGLVCLLLEAAVTPPSRIAIVTESQVAGLYLEAFREILAQGAWQVHEIVVPPGESSKSMGQLGEVWGGLIEAGLDRGDVVVALGGGVVGDLAGFAAATLMRGVRWVQVPTTILSFVDSSIGGKTGINHGGGKNLVGSFHQPIGVVLVPQVLATLTRREVSSGLAEVVKYGVLEGGALLERLERDAEDLVDHPEDHGDLFGQCCAVKGRIVADDEREQGARALLNLGHTFGHAIEAMEGYGGVTHGEAVSLGMVMAAQASRILGLSEEDLVPRIASVLSRVGLPVDGSRWLAQEEAMAAQMSLDKKSRGTSIDLILPRRAGQVEIHRMEKHRLGWLLREIAR